MTVHDDIPAGRSVSRRTLLGAVGVAGLWAAGIVGAGGASASVQDARASARGYGGVAPGSVAGSLVLPDPQYSDPLRPGIARAQIFDRFVDVGRESELDPSEYDGLPYYYIWASVKRYEGEPLPPAGLVESRYRPFVRFGDLLPNNEPPTLEWFETNHPDWVLYKDDQVTPAWFPGNMTLVPMNFTNTGAREYYYDNYVAPSIAQGYPMVAFDNLSVYNNHGAAGFYDGLGNWVQRYSEQFDQTFADDTLDWLSYLVGRVHAADVGVAGNILMSPTAVAAGHLHNVGDAVDLVDVYVDEAGITRGQDVMYSGTTWLNKFNFIRSKNANSLYVQINKTTTPDLADAFPEQVNFAISNFLLWREEKSMLALVGKTAGEGGFSYLVDHDKLYTDIGAPTEAPVEEVPQGWRRTYDDGIVYVNSSQTTTATFSVPAGNWVTLDGQNIVGPTSFVLEPVAVDQNCGDVLTPA